MFLFWQHSLLQLAFATFCQSKKLYSLAQTNLQSWQFTAVCTNRTHKSHLTPKSIEGCDLCEWYGETSYVFPKNTNFIHFLLIYNKVCHIHFKGYYPKILFILYHYKKYIYAERCKLIGSIILYGRHLCSFCNCCTIHAMFE